MREKKKTELLMEKETSMKTLTKVILIQWFRLDASEIPIIGNTAFIGDNGAGKSALLDAIQTVLTGGDRNLLVLNRGSNEQSSRKLWEYVLGVLSDPRKPELSLKLKPREKANCYLALNFLDHETGETTCVGLGISATLADMAERIEGWFICPGLIGNKDLFLEQRAENSMVVLPWHRVKERLAKNCPGTWFYNNVGDYKRNLYFLLCNEIGSPKDYRNHQTILKALQAAFRLEKISDPTEFIRRYMLDQDNLQITELQSALKRYREMAEKTESVSRRIHELSQLQAHCDKVAHARAQQVLMEWLSLSARSEELENQANPLRESLEELEEEKEKLTGQRKTLDEKQEKLQRLVGEKLAALNNLDIGVKRESLAVKIEKTRMSEQQALDKIREVRLQIQHFEDVKDVPANGLVEKALAVLIKQSPGDDLISIESWPKNPGHIDMALENMRDAANDSLSHIEERFRKMSAGINDFEKQHGQLANAIRQLEKGKAPLDERTIGLIRLLRDIGIPATPLCNLVDVTDESWRGTIESILGNLREALIVDPEQARDAVRLYRHEGRRDFPGRHIVNTTHTERWKDSCQKGSLAELIVTEDSYARAFINRRLGNIIRVYTEKDLLRHDRAATADGMLNSGGTVTDTKKFAPILGSGSREKLLISYRVELKELSEKKVAEERKCRELGKLVNLFSDFLARISESGRKPMVFWVNQRDNAQNTVRELQAELAALEGDEQEKRLHEELEILNKEVDDIKADISSLNSKIEETNTIFVQNGATLKELDKQLDFLYQILEEKRNDPLFDAEKSAEILDRWRDLYGGKFSEICGKAGKEIESANKVIEASRDKVMTGYTEYYVKYATEEGDETPPADFEDYVATITRKKNHLVETTLAEYREKSERALREAETTFRSKFVSRLIEKIETVRRNIVQLNKTLAKHPFHGEIYKFRYDANPEFRHIIEFAKACSGPAFQEVGGLFDPAADPNSPHRKALEDITSALQSPDAAKRLQDYRNFLVFDVDMFDTEGVQTAELKHRIQKGSGGENQTPFYVAIGASLSAAYRLKEGFGGEIQGGMSLAVFDEAFSKLSVATCHSCIEFLKNIHLQLLVAAPDEKFATMAEVMDTIVWVTRDSGTVETEVSYIKPAMRAFLRSDNPYRQSAGVSEFGNEPIQPPAS
jgi:uncharacterized protein YPO0396